jgi:hypothetical protein
VLWGGTITLGVTRFSGRNDAVGCEARPHPVPLPRERENVGALLEKTWLLVQPGLEAAMAGESV